jgi:hypothetical protein
MAPLTAAQAVVFEAGLFQSRQGVQVGKIGLAEIEVGAFHKGGKGWFSG